MYRVGLDGLPPMVTTTDHKEGWRSYNPIQEDTHYPSDREQEPATKLEGVSPGRRQHHKDYDLSHKCTGVASTLKTGVIAHSLHANAINQPGREYYSAKDDPCFKQGKWVRSNSKIDV